jgi:hypothetical protein
MLNSGFGGLHPPAARVGLGGLSGGIGGGEFDLPIEPELPEGGVAGGPPEGASSEFPLFLVTGG